MTFSVSLVSGQVSATKSACGSSVFNSASVCTESAPSVPFDRSRLTPITRMSKALASRARRPPMPPSPTTRSVFASELVLALRQVREHAAPHMLGLIIACLRQPPGQRQNERHHVFGNGVDIDALRAGEADAALLEHCTVELIGAGTDRLNEAQLRRT